MSSDGEVSELLDEVFGLHGFDLAVPFNDNPQAVFVVATQGLANAPINSLTDDSTILPKDAIDVLLCFGLHWFP